jgi:hypothetical protein
VNCQQVDLILQESCLHRVRYSYPVSFYIGFRVSEKLHVGSIRDEIHVSSFYSDQIFRLSERLDMSNYEIALVHLTFMSVHM